MQHNYKGYEITVKREEAMGGWMSVYTTIVRLSDLYICKDDFVVEWEDTVHDIMRWMKELVDEEEKSDDPWGEKAEEERMTSSGFYKVEGGYTNVPPT